MRESAVTTYVNKRAIMLPTHTPTPTFEPQNVVEIPDHNTPIGEGVFGVVRLRKILTLDTVVAAKFSRDKEDAIDNEIRVMEALKGYSGVPYFYGIVSPKTMLLEYIGDRDGPYSPGITMDQQLKANTLNRTQWLYAAQKLIATLTYIHGMMYLHNDLHTCNIVFRPKWDPPAQLLLISAKGQGQTV